MALKKEEVAFTGVGVKKAAVEKDLAKISGSLLVVVKRSSDKL